MPDKNQHLRPIERTVRRLLDSGQSRSEIAWRLRRSPGFVHRVEALSAMPRPPSPLSHNSRGLELRPIENCVMNMLDSGSGYAEIASKLRRTPNYVARVEQFAKLRMATASPG